MSVSVSRSVSHDSISFFFLLSLSPSHKRSKFPPTDLKKKTFFPPLFSNFPLSSVESTAKTDRKPGSGQKSRLAEFVQILPVILSQSASADFEQI